VQKSQSTCYTCRCRGGMHAPSKFKTLTFSVPFSMSIISHNRSKVVYVDAFSLQQQQSRTRSHTAVRAYVRSSLIPRTLCRSNVVSTFYRATMQTCCELCAVIRNVCKQADQPLPLASYPVDEIASRKTRGMTTVPHALFCGWVVRVSLDLLERSFNNALTCVYQPRQAD